MPDQPMPSEKPVEVLDDSQLRGQRERFLAKLADIARKMQRTKSPKQVAPLKAQ